MASILVLLFPAIGFAGAGFFVHQYREHEQFRQRFAARDETIEDELDERVPELV